MNFLKTLIALLKETAVFLFLNALGIRMDLLFKSWWLDPIRNDRIDPVREWLGESLPLIAFYFGINTTWLVMSRKNGVLGIGRLSIWLLVCLVWVIVLASDPLNLRGFLEMLNGTAWPP
jgi:hypothetical protein